LRSRTNRLCKFSDVGEVESVLEHLMRREDGPFVARLPRDPGKKESRYAHLFSGPVQAVEISEEFGAAPGLSGSDRERLENLEQRIGELVAEIEQLKCRLEQLVRGKAVGTEA
jgi:uncharacterized protein YceH (UPF0502 family)